MCVCQRVFEGCDVAQKGSQMNWCMDGEMQECVEEYREVEGKCGFACKSRELHDWQ